MSVEMKPNPTHAFFFKVKFNVLLSATAAYCYTVAATNLRDNLSIGKCVCFSDTCDY